MKSAHKRRAHIVRSCFLVLTATVAGAGCASAIEGTRQQVVFSSDPPGAAVIVDGANLGTTPAEIELGRRHSHSVRIEKAGYLPYETTTSSNHNNWEWVYVVPSLIFFPVLFFDNFDAGAYEIEPHEVTAHLVVAPPAPNP